jgi:hypothetical protein
MPRESEIDLRSSMEIINISSKYIIASVLLVAIGAVSLVYAGLIWLVYGVSGLAIAIFFAFFLGIAFLIIGVFLTFWGVYWIRKEGQRLRKRFKIGPPEKPAKIVQTKKETEKS